MCRCSTAEKSASISSALRMNWVNEFQLTKRSHMRNVIWNRSWLALIALLAATTFAADSPTSKPAAPQLVPEPKQVGGEPDGVVQVANLVYAGTKTSTCFSDHFLAQ